MRTLITVASVIGLAAGSANCGSSHDGLNSASKTLPLESMTGPSALEARNGGGGGKGGNTGGDTSGGSSSLTLVMVNDANGNGAPNWGDSVTFTISTVATTQPHVDLGCSQNGVVVYSASAGFFASYTWPWMQTMTLSSRAWTGGAADCTATLYYLNGSKKAVLATLRFTAQA
jgi:hypothetical protein